MLHKRESLFILLCRTSFTLAEAKMCYKYERTGKGEEKKIVAFIYCDSSTDDCCDTGCCAKIIAYNKEIDSLLVFIYVLLSVSVLLILTRCFTCFCKQHMNSNPIVDNRYSPHDTDTDVMICSPPPYLAPPPPYDAAPSYEDVIAGKVT